MNEHSLPEDLSLWPKNSFELLGVAPGIDELTLRRAYSRLIRNFKPEQFPEHFRRIREAYETARHYVERSRPYERPDDSPAPEPASEIAAGEHHNPLAQVRSLEEELDEAWNWAVDGDESRAYTRLRELRDQHPHRSEIGLRLYSLLSVAPELDSGRSPCEFLVEALCRTGGQGPCRELYRREIEDNPHEALTDRFLMLLAGVKDPQWLSTFVEWRWDAAIRNVSFDVIEYDLPKLRNRFSMDHEEIWLRLVASAAERMAWSPKPMLVGRMDVCELETERLSHLQLRCSDIFDRLELFKLQGIQWRSLLEKPWVPANFTLLIRQYRTQPFPKIRRNVVSVLSEISEKPGLWLQLLDHIHNDAPIVLSSFADMLRSYQWTITMEEDDRDERVLTEIARKFLEENIPFNYFQVRKQMLDFCLREMIHPDFIGRAAIDMMVPRDQVNKHTNQTHPTHIYQACILFRN